MDAARGNASMGSVFGWSFGILLLAVGVANLLLVHPVPALAYGLAALLYLPPVGRLLGKRFGFSIPPIAKVAIAIGIVMFTLGVSDLGDMLD